MILHDENDRLPETLFCLFDGLSLALETAFDIQTAWFSSAELTATTPIEGGELTVTGAIDGGFGLVSR